MNSKSSSVPWWSALGFGSKAAPAPDTDYADMGTAFGLDASMGAHPLPDERDAAPKEKGRPPSAGTGPVRKR